MKANKINRYKAILRSVGLGDEDPVGWREAELPDEAFDGWVTDRAARRPSGPRARRYMAPRTCTTSHGSRSSKNWRLVRTTMSLRSAVAAGFFSELHSRQVLVRRGSTTVKKWRSWRMQRLSART